MTKQELLDKIANEEYRRKQKIREAKNMDANNVNKKIANITDMPRDALQEALKSAKKQGKKCVQNLQAVNLLSSQKG
jgi:vacuolar-type H+-ATPase subunit H